VLYYSIFSHVLDKYKAFFIVFSIDGKVVVDKSNILEDAKWTENGPMGTFLVFSRIARAIRME
jgi:hypothetical protein